MTTLAFAGRSFSELAATLLQDDRESCAVAFAVPTRDGDGTVRRQLIQQIEILEPGQYRARGALQATLKPEYVANVAKRARLAGHALVFIHTHPFAGGQPMFSSIDDVGERTLQPFLIERAPHGTHVALVIGPRGCKARALGESDPVRVVQAGATLDVIFDPRYHPIAHDYDRQVRLFGKAGQEAVQRLVVGIVGLGGTGSVVAQELAYLGVSQFILVDPDVVDETNLNRLVGAYKNDVGIHKVEVARRHIATIAPMADVRVVPADVLAPSIAQALLGADLLFGCTDSQASRALLQQISYQYYIPCIDIGVSITTADSEVKYITGRTQMLAPGIGCLTCADLLDGAAIRRELMTSEQRRSDPYFIGAGVPQPAVVSINSTMASLAVSMFLAAAAKVPGKARFQIYDGIAGTVRAAAVRPNPACVVCSAAGSLGKGDDWPLPFRPKS